MDDLRELARQFRTAAAASFQDDEVAIDHVYSIADRALGVVCMVAIAGRLNLDALMPGHALTLMTPFEVGRQAPRYEGLLASIKALAFPEMHEFNPKKRIRLRRMAWQMLLSTIASANPVRFPDRLLAGGFKCDGGIPDLGTSGAAGFSGGYDKGRWRRLALDSAVLSDFLWEHTDLSSLNLNGFVGPFEGNKLAKVYGYSRLAKFRPTLKVLLASKAIIQWCGGFYVRREVLSDNQAEALGVLQKKSEEQCTPKSP